MNLIERLAIWQKHLAAAQDALDTVRSRFPDIGGAMQSQIRAGWKKQVQTAQEYIAHYERKIAA